MRRTSGLVIAASAALAAASALAPGATAAPAQVSGYVVVLEDGAGAPAAVAERLADRYGGDVGYIYRHALRGFYVRTTDRAAVAMASNPNVAYVEAESPVSIDVQSTPTGVRRAFATSNAALDIDGTDDLRVDADVAVLDTGIDLDHPDLAVAGSISCVNVSSAASCSGTGNDVHGHGTHVAGSIAALDNGDGVVGMAPGARLWSVKVLGNSGSGSNAGVAAGLDWVAGKGGIEVANLSLGGSDSKVIKEAVARTVGAGVSVVVAAGNSGADASNYSPANAPEAITVSALSDFNGQAGGGAAASCYPDQDDTLADYSNYGSMIDIIAPGTCILSTVPNGYGTKSGTSMASPHVAGAAALLRSAGVSRENTESLLKSEGNDNWSGDRDKTPEPLLDVSDATVFKPKLIAPGGGGTTPTNNPPAASFTSSCTDLDCTFTDTSTDGDGTIASRSWSFGDGIDSAATNPSHTYGAEGTYTVTLTVTDDDGASDSETKTVTVTAPAGDDTTPTFTPSSAKNGRSAWKATIAVSGAASGTTVSGTWTYGGSTSPGGCTTGSTGTCSFSLSKIPIAISSVTWTHTASGEVVPVGKP